MDAPTSIGQTRSLRPKANGTAIGVSNEFAAAKVEPEMALCARFWRLMSRILRSPKKPIRPMSIAITAPTTAVFGETPSVVIMWIPMTVPRMLTRIVTISISGSNARGWRSWLRFVASG
jgi:hypothetical protein